MAEALAAATGDESLLSTGINAGTRLKGDLCLDSLDLAALSALLRDRYVRSESGPPAAAARRKCLAQVAR
jgi:hypothetical protein